MQNAIEKWVGGAKLTKAMPFNIESQWTPNYCSLLRNYEQNVGITMGPFKCVTYVPLIMLVLSA